PMIATEVLRLPTTPPGADGLLNDRKAYARPVGRGSTRARHLPRSGDPSGLPTAARGQTDSPADRLPTRANGYGLSDGDQPSPPTDRDDAERTTGVYGSVSVVPGGSGWTAARIGAGHGVRETIALRCGEVGRVRRMSGKRNRSRRSIVNPAARTAA